MCPLWGRSLPKVSNDIAGNDDWKGEIDFEEIAGDFIRIIAHAPNGPNGNIRLGEENEEDENETDPASPYTKHGSEWQFLDAVTLDGPRTAETNVAEHDGTPGEESGETGKGEEPCKDFVGCGGQVDIGEGSKGQNEDNGPEWTTGFVNVRKHFGCVSGFGEGGECAGATVDAGETDTEDGDANGHVDEVVDTLDMCTVEDADEWRRSGGSTSKEKEFVVVRQEETDHEEGEDVDDGDTPKGVLDRTGHRLAWVGRLRSGESDEFGTCKGKGGGDKHGADSLESIGECTWVMPERATDVAVIFSSSWASTADENDSNEDEHDHDEELETAGPKLFFCVSEGAEYVDEHDCKEEDGDPGGEWDFCRVLPVTNGDTCSGDFEWEYDGPLEDIVPTHGKAPGRVEHTNGESVKATGKRVKDGHFTNSLAGHEYHETDDDPIQDEGSRSTHCQGST